MNEYKEKIKTLCERLEKALAILDLEGERGKLRDLEAQTSDPNFWHEQGKAQAVMQNASQLKKHLDSWDNITKEISDLAELVSTIDENDHKAVKEIADMYDKLTKEFETYEFELMFSGEFDQNNAIINISAGSGGTDAQDWAEMLARMYFRFSEKNGFNIKTLEQTSGEEAGIKSISLLVEGTNAYGNLKSEYGVHRLVRLSPFDADNARHTSFALVEALPVIQEEKFKVSEKDLRIDVFRSGGHGGQSVNTTDSAVRITHTPTGTTATSQNERSQLQNKENALRVLTSKLVVLADKQKAKELSDIKGEPVSAEWGNQIRSYVLHPYTLVKDNRTQYETSDTQSVLDGNLSGFIEAYLRKQASKNK
jgi:peptide chain release factor 2